MSGKNDQILRDIMIMESRRRSVKSDGHDGELSDAMKDIIDFLACVSAPGIRVMEKCESTSKDSALSPTLPDPIIRKE